MLDFLMISNHSPQKVEVPAENLAMLADRIAGGGFIEGELLPTSGGEIKRVLIPTCRIQMVVEGQ